MELLCDLFLPVVQSQAVWGHDTLATRLFRDRYTNGRLTARRELVDTHEAVATVACQLNDTTPRVL